MFCEKCKKEIKDSKKQNHHIFDHIRGDVYELLLRFKHLEKMILKNGKRFEDFNQIKWYDVKSKEEVKRDS